MSIATVETASHYSLVEMLVIVDTVARLDLNSLAVVAALDWSFWVVCATRTHSIVFESHCTIFNSFSTSGLGSSKQHS